MKLSEAYKDIIVSEAEENHYNSSGSFVKDCNFVLDNIAPAVAINFLLWTLGKDCDYIPLPENGMFAHYETDIHIHVADLFEIFVDNFYSQD